MSKLFGEIRQLGMIVRDADAAMQKWLKLGVGPWYVLDITFDKYFYRGKPSPSPVLQVCFAHSGPLQLELIEQKNDTPSGYTEFLDAGREGCHHICAWFADHESFQEKRRTMLDGGYTAIHEGSWGDGHFTFFDLAEPGGLHLELAEALMPLPASILQRMLRETEEWDGVVNPIRNFL